MTRLRTILALGAAVLLAGLVFIIYTPTGLRWTYHVARSLVPGTLTIARLDGRLAGPVTMESLSYENTVVRITGGRLTIDWSLPRLLIGQLDISHISAEDVTVAVKKSPDRQPGINTSLPPILPIRIADGHLDKLIILPESGTAVSVDTVSVSLSTLAGALELDELHVVTPQLTVSARGSVPFDDGAEIGIETEWQTRVQAVSLHGHGRISGSLHEIRFTQTLDQPVPIQGTGRIQLAGTTAGWQITVTAGRFRLDRILPGSRPLFLDGNLAATGQGPQWQASSRLNLSDSEFGNWRLDSQAGGNNMVLDTARFSVDSTTGPDHIEASLTPAANTSDSQDQEVPSDYQLQASWKALRLPDTKQPSPWSSPSGTLLIKGHPDNYQFSLRGRVAVPSIVTPLEVAMTGHGERSGLVVSELDSDWLDGTWSGNARFSWQGPPRWHVTVAGRQLNPATVWPEWPGRLNAGVTIGNPDPGNSTAIHVELTELAGQLRGVPVTGRLRADWLERTLQVDQLQLQSGRSSFQARARFARQWDIDWKLDSPDLHELHPDLSGTLSTQGSITGPADALQIKSQIGATNLVYQDNRIATLTGDTVLAMNPQGKWHIDLRAENAVFAGNTLQRIQLAGDGTTAAHALTLSIRHDQDQFDQPWSGSVAGRQWQLRAHDGTLQSPQTGAWHQVDSASVIIGGDDHLDIDHYCWTDGRTNACLQGNVTADGRLVAGVDWRQFELSLLHRWLPYPVNDVNGTTSGTLQVSFADHAIRSLRVSATAGQGDIRYLLPGGNESHVTTFRQAEVAVDANRKSGARGEAHITLNDTESIDASVRFPDWSGDRFRLAPAQRVTGQLDLQLQDLSVLSLLAPELQLTPGQARLHVTATGTTAQPRLDGMLTLDFPSVGITSLGLTMHNVAASVQLKKNNWDMNSTLTIGDGPLTINGHGFFVNRDQWQARFAVLGENVESMHIPTAVLWLSPDLTADLKPGRLVFDGSVRIPRARIEPVTPETQVRASEDVVITGTDEPVTSPPTFITQGKVRIVFGDDVRLSGRGLTGRLTGQVVVSMDEAGHMTGQGEINIIDGKYRAYGQNLIITSGRLLYSGNPINNPSIDFTAVRQKPDVEVGVHVTGTARKPVLTLVSTPAMEDSDILSYLILGRPLNQATSQDGRLLHQAATSLALVGGERMADSIAEQFDLHEVTIESGETPAETAIALGKYVTPRIYVRYVQSLVDTIATFQIRYQLSDAWMIETESNNRSGGGGDLIYTFEH